MEAPTSPPVPARAPVESHRYAAVRVVVVHYRCLGATRALLAALERDAPGVAVVVVANGSGDGSDEALVRELGDRADRRVVARDDNRGFGAGCNAGIEVVLADPQVEHVLLLNPDVETTPGFLDELLAAARRHPDAAAIGCRILSMDGERVLFEHGRVRRLTLTRCQIGAPAGDEDHRVDFVSGACVLLDANVLRAGLRFDERFFLYAEDLDLGRRIEALGRTCRVTRHAVVRHADGGTQRDEAAFAGGMRPTQLHHLARSKMIFAKKWLTRSERAVFTFVALFGKPLIGLLVWRSIPPVRAHLRGVFDGLRAAREVESEVRR